MLTIELAKIESTDGHIKIMLVTEITKIKLKIEINRRPY